MNQGFIENYNTLKINFNFFTYVETQQVISMSTIKEIKEERETKPN